MPKSAHAGPPAGAANVIALDARRGADRDSDPDPPPAAPGAIAGPPRRAEHVDLVARHARALRVAA